MYYNCYNYTDAVHYAANLVLMDRTAVRSQRIERLFELLYSLAESIPVSWGTTSQAMLARREGSIERIVQSLSFDVVEHQEYSNYSVLSSVLSVALSIKQLTAYETSCN